MTTPLNYHSSLRSILLFCLLACPIRSFAHARGMGTLDIHQQRHQLLLTWVFYYDELPAQLVLPTQLGSSERDLAQIKQNISTIAETAFQLRIANQPIKPSKISQLLVLPDKTCLVLLDFPTPVPGPLELRAPILNLLPPNYLINVRFVNSAGKPTSTLITRGSPPVITSLQTDNTAPNDSQNSRTAFSRAFATEMGIPWIHTNWLLLTLLLILSIPIRHALVLLAAAIITRIPPSHLWFGQTYMIPGIVLCLPILVLAWFATRPRHSFTWIALITILSAIIYTDYDLQFRASDFSTPTLLGQDIGFAAGLLLAAAILCALNMELNKFLADNQVWRRRLCWGIAGISMWLSLLSIGR